MKSDARAKQVRVALEAEEASLRARLLTLLPSVARDGAQLFVNSVNSVNSPETIARYSHRDADTLFACAQRCVELRKSLGLVGEANVAEYILTACGEAASADAHRRGPRKLAEWLLAKVAPCDLSARWSGSLWHMDVSTDLVEDQEQLVKLRQEAKHQIVVLIVPTLGAEPIESFSLRTFNKLGLGRKGINDGILICLAMKEKRVRIELGLGMERYISNADAVKIIDTEMTPSFSKGDFAGGLERGLKRLMEEGRRFTSMNIGMATGYDRASRRLVNRLEG